MTLPKPLLDHCPVMLDTQCERWGPSPFRFELMWLDEKELSGLIKEWWGSCVVEGKPGFVQAYKIKERKVKIKEWAKNHFGEIRVVKMSILEEIQLLDKKEEDSQLDENERIRRLQLKGTFRKKV